MNSRIALEPIADHLRPDMPAGTLRVGTGYDFDYLTTVATTYPAVWVGNERMRKIGQTGDGYSGIVRQHCEVKIDVQIVVQRYVLGEVSREAELSKYADAVATSLFGYRLPGMDLPFLIESSQDGPAYESVLTAIFTFAAQITFQVNV